MMMQATDGNKRAPARRDLGDAERDHVPGSTGDIRELARRLTALAEGFTADADELMRLVHTAQDGTDHWSGAFQDAFVRLAPSFAALMDGQLAPVLHQAGSSLGGYAEEIAMLQGQAKAEVARGQQAENTRVNLVDLLQQRQQAAAHSPTPAAREQARVQVTDVDAALTPPQNTVDDALRSLRRIREERAAADAVVAQRLSRAAEGARLVATAAREITGSWGEAPPTVPTDPDVDAPPPAPGVDIGTGPVIGASGLPAPDDGADETAVTPVPSIGAATAPVGTAPSGIFTPLASDAGTDLIEDARSGDALAGFAAGGAALGAAAVAGAATRRGPAPVEGGVGSGIAAATTGGTSSAAGASAGGHRTGRAAHGEKGRAVEGDAVDLGAIVPIVGAAAGAAVAMYLIGDRALRAGATRPRPGAAAGRAGHRSGGFRERWLDLGRRGLGPTAQGGLGDEPPSASDDGATPGPPISHLLPGGLEADIPASWRVVTGDECIVITPGSSARPAGANIVVFVDTSGTAALDAGIRDLPGAVVVEDGPSPAVAPGGRIRFGYVLGTTALTVDRHILAGTSGVPVVLTATVATGRLADAGPGLDAVLATVRAAG